MNKWCVVALKFVLSEVEGSQTLGMADNSMMVRRAG